MEKTVYVILAFHAHEPLWDLPGQLQRSLSDLRMVDAVLGENYIRKRLKEGRNIYRRLLAFCRELKSPATLDITNELLYQLATIWPQAMEDLKGGYREGLIHPLYTTAHHTHALFLNEAELAEEIALNEEFLHEIMEVPRPRYRGFFFTENSVPNERLKAVKRARMDYIIFPHLSPRKARYQLERLDYDYTFRPFIVGDGIVALPRHFPVSQEIWRPLTRLDPGKAKYQGYIMGEYFVFDTEFQQKSFLETPIEMGRAVEEYTHVLQSALDKAPDGGLILYIQDLELMDFGDLALEVKGEAWKRVLAEERVNVRFVTPDQFLETVNRKVLPRLEFSGISWAPEIRLVLRYDGHYPPLNGGDFHGLDAVPQIFPKYPFIFWEPGRPMTDLFTWLLKSFGLSLTPGVPAHVLLDEEYQFTQFPPEKRLPLHLRLMKRACNWGWRPDEGRTKRPYLHGFLISDYLLLHLRLYPDQLPNPMEPFPRRSMELFQRLPEVFIDTRIDYLTFGLHRLRDERGVQVREALAELEYARGFREQASMHLARVPEAITGLKRGPRTLPEAFVSYLSRVPKVLRWRKTRAPELPLWQDLLLGLREHCRYIFLSLDHIQQAWKKAPDIDFLVNAMYKYLYDIYPPKYPAILDEVGKEQP